MQQVQFYLKGPQGMATVTADMVKDTGRSPPPYSAMRVQYYPAIIPGDRAHIPADRT